jgi:hypothetical protein
MIPEGSGDSFGLPKLNSSKKKVLPKGIPSWGSLYNPLYNPPAIPGPSGGTPSKPKSTLTKKSSKVKVTPPEPVVRDIFGRGDFHLGGGEAGGQADRRSTSLTVPVSQVTKDKTAQSLQGPQLPRGRGGQGSETEGGIDFGPQKFDSSKAYLPSHFQTDSGQSPEGRLADAARYTGISLNYALYAEQAGDYELFKQFMPNKMSAEMARQVFGDVGVYAEGWYAWWQHYYTEDGLLRDLATDGYGDGGGAPGGGGGFGSGFAFPSSGDGDQTFFNAYGPYSWRW